MLQLDLLVDVGAVLAEQALSCNLLLSRSEELAPVRVGLHEEGSNHSNDEGEQAFEEEDVTPAVDDHGGNAERRDSNETCSKQAAEGACERTSRDEDSDAEEEFVPLVETGKEECDAGHGAALGQTQECSRNVKSGVSLYECCAERDEAECHDQEGDPESGADRFEDDVRRNLNAAMSSQLSAREVGMDEMTNAM